MNVIVQGVSFDHEFLVNGRMPMQIASLPANPNNKPDSKPIRKGITISKMLKNQASL
jgi:hypothetical protein